MFTFLLCISIVCLVVRQQLISIQHFDDVAAMQLFRVRGANLFRNFICLVSKFKKVSLCPFHLLGIKIKKSFVMSISFSWYQDLKKFRYVHFIYLISKFKQVS